MGNLAAAAAKMLGDILVGALMHVLIFVHDWFFTKERGKFWRMRLREHWWTYHQRAEETPSQRDNQRAACWADLMGFKTPPEEAVARGDLVPVTKRVMQDEM